MSSPDYAEAIYMVKIKRERAKAALSAIIERYGVFSNEAGTSLEVLLDYFTNMVSGVELLLKVMAKDWDGPKKTRFGHNFAAMYKEIFGRDYTRSDLMTHLEDAIKDQKYAYEPHEPLLDRVPEIETLWDELTGKYYGDNWGQIQHVKKDISMPGGFGEYLCQNVARFYRAERIPIDPHSRDQRIAMLELRIKVLQQQIDGLRALTETEEEERQRFIKQLESRYVEKLSSLQFTMQMQLHEMGCRIVFGIYTATWCGGGFLG